MGSRTRVEVVVAAASLAEDSPLRECRHGRPGSPSYEVQECHAGTDWRLFELAGNRGWSVIGFEGSSFRVRS